MCFVEVAILAGMVFRPHNFHIKIFMTTEPSSSATFYGLLSILRRKSKETNPILLTKQSFTLLCGYFHDNLRGDVPLYSNSQHRKLYRHFAMDNNIDAWKSFHSSQRRKKSILIKSRAFSVCEESIIQFQVSRMLESVRRNSFARLKNRNLKTAMKLQWSHKMR